MEGNRPLLPYSEIRKHGFNVHQTKHLLRMRHKNGLETVLKRIGYKFYYYEADLLSWLNRR
jgi:hypothetical protein